MDINTDSSRARATEPDMALAHKDTMASGGSSGLPVLNDTRGSLILKDQQGSDAGSDCLPLVLLLGPLWQQKPRMSIQSLTTGGPWLLAAVLGGSGGLLDRHFL